MNLKFPALVSAITVFFFSGTVSAQETPKYDYVEAFKPFFYPQTGTETRSASGQPGHAYWQNSADYHLSVSLNESKKKLQVLQRLNIPTIARINLVSFGFSLTRTCLQKTPAAMLLFLCQEAETEPMEKLLMADTLLNL